MTGDHCDHSAPLAELPTWTPPEPADWAADLAARSVALRSWGFKDPTVEALLVAYTRL